MVGCLACFFHRHSSRRARIGKRTARAEENPPLDPGGERHIPAFLRGERVRLLQRPRARR